MPTSIGIIVKAKEFQKDIFFCFTDYTKAFDTTNYGKILEEVGIPDHITYLLRNVYAGQEAIVRMEHGTTSGSKLGKEYVKAVYCNPTCLTSMQSTSCKMLAWMKHKLESRLPGEISITSDMQITLPLWQKAKELKSLLMKVKEESEKVP